LTNRAEDLVWLITGCSTGIGREIAKCALESGARVAVTARKAEAVADIVEGFPEQALGVALDVTRPEQIAEAVTATERAFGRIDVLVNNAGYGYVAAVEEGEEEDVRALFDTNFFGAIALIKAVLPGMRSRRTGFICNVSSMTGLVSNPGVVYYSASKFALESLSEGIAKEVAPFGIRVTVVEPGAFRTDWSGRSMQESPRQIDDYASTVGARRKMLKGVHGTQVGDPRRVGEAVVMLSGLEDPPLHLLLGRDVYEAYTQKLESLQASIAEWKDVTLDVDFPDADIGDRPAPESRAREEKAES
jgi:NAD(P)-dependent dehydrogenase (short-subunit alcohol dehydrogenase family)